MHVQVSPADISRLERRIRSINGMAQIRQVQRAEVDVEYVLGIGGFELETIEKEASFTFPPSPFATPLPCTYLGHHKLACMAVVTCTIVVILKLSNLVPALRSCSMSSRL